MLQLPGTVSVGDVPPPCSVRLESPGPRDVHDMVAGPAASAAAVLPSSIAISPPAVRCRCRRQRSSAQPPPAAASATAAAPTAMPAMAPPLRLLLPLLPAPPPGYSCSRAVLTYRMLVGLRNWSSSDVSFLATAMVCGSGRPCQSAPAGGERGACQAARRLAKGLGTSATSALELLRCCRLL